MKSEESYPKWFVHVYTMVQKGDEASNSRQREKNRKLSRAAGGTKSYDFYEMIVD